MLKLRTGNGRPRGGGSGGAVEGSRSREECRVFQGTDDGWGYKHCSVTEKESAGRAWPSAHVNLSAIGGKKKREVGSHFVDLLFLAGRGGFQQAMNVQKQIIANNKKPERGPPSSIAFPGGCSIIWWLVSNYFSILRFLRLQKLCVCLSSRKVGVWFFFWRCLFFCRDNYSHPRVIQRGPLLLFWLLDFIPSHHFYSLSLVICGPAASAQHRLALSRTMTPRRPSAGGLQQDSEGSRHAPTPREPLLKHL